MKTLKQIAIAILVCYGSSIVAVQSKQAIKEHLEAKCYSLTNLNAVQWGRSINDMTDMINDIAHDTDSVLARRIAKTKDFLKHLVSQGEYKFAFEMKKELTGVIHERLHGHGHHALSPETRESLTTLNNDINEIRDDLMNAIETKIAKTSPENEHYARLKVLLSDVEKDAKKK